ncbi:MAG: TM2 domain-containing protein [Leptospirales bacterium]
MKNRAAAGIFAILLGGFGDHKFDLDQVGMGALCPLFCWTFIPAIVGLIEGILYLTLPMRISMPNSITFRFQTHQRTIGDGAQGTKRIAPVRHFDRRRIPERKEKTCGKDVEESRGLGLVLIIPVAIC